jgi:hypothetical protein
MGWQNLSSSPAPQDESTVLFWDPILGVIFGHWSTADEDEDEGDLEGAYGDFWVFQDFVGDYVEGVEPTHWMPLPGKPEQ